MCDDQLHDDVLRVRRLPREPLLLSFHRTRGQRQCRSLLLRQRLQLRRLRLPA